MKGKQKFLPNTHGAHWQPENIGNAALYMASNAAKYITGVVLPVGGGNSIGF